MLRYLILVLMWKAKIVNVAMEFANKTIGTRKVVIFDEVLGGINVSESLAEELLWNSPHL